LLLTLAGCQEELVVVEEPSPSEVVTANSSIAQLVLRVTLNDGSSDNIIDSTSCSSILLPVSVTANGQKIMLNSNEDLSTIEIIFNQSEEDTDVLKIIYPITVILSDYSELIIANESMFKELQEGCENGIDIDIECVDFQYPITLFIYDSNKQTADIITIDNDKELFVFFETLDVEDLVGFDFPFLVTLYDGQEIEINDNIELEQTIESLIDECDEEDEVEDEVDDDDGEVSLEIKTILISGDWKIILYSDVIDETAAFDGFEFMFNSIETVSANDGIGGTTNGEWHLNINDDDPQVFDLELDFDFDLAPLVLLDGEWHITSFSQTKIEMKGESETDGVEKMLTIEKL